MSIRHTIPLIIFILITLFMWLGLGKNPNLLPSVLLNKPLPIVNAPQLDEQSVPVTLEQFKGQITLLNVWATWCDNCHLEHPIFLDIARQQRIQIIGLNYKDDRSAAKKYLSAMGNPYVANIYDPTGKIGMQLGVYGTPETFIIDQDGIVRYKFIGPITLDTWQKIVIPQVQKLLKKN